VNSLRKEVELNNKEKALQNFKNGFNCSQAVLSPYSDKYGLDPGTGFRISCGFGGGIARTGETCGAVTGACMAIGLNFGNISPADSDGKMKTYSKVNEFLDGFVELNQYLKCRELLGCDLRTPEGNELSKQKNFHSTLCAKFVGDAVDILERILE
jgi:C_GCAxxG_C_C family probable redox protein